MLAAHARPYRARRADMTAASWATPSISGGGGGTMSGLVVSARRRCKLAAENPLETWGTDITRRVAFGGGAA